MHESFKWPPKSRLNFYRRNHLWCTTTNRETDLADFLMLRVPGAYLTVSMGLSSKSVRWKNWDEENVGRIEEQINTDLESDGYKVSSCRLSAIGISCDQEFLWKLKIRPAL